MILSDSETKVDLLNNEAIAKTIIGLLKERPDHPVTIGVHGDWGAGKSSILEMIEAELDNDEKVLCLKFNGWRFQGFEDAKVALIEGIVTGLIERRPKLTKAVTAVKDVFKRIDLLKVAKRAGGLALTAYTGIPTPEQISEIKRSIERIAKNPSELVTPENLNALVKEVKAVTKQRKSKNLPEEAEEFRKAFDKLLKAAGVEQLVVLVDDLDRCLPDTVIETLEAIRLFVFTSRTAFVIAADETMVEYAVRKHFPDLPESTGPRDYARNYLEKLIQVPFRIPVLGETETRIYVTMLLVGSEVGEDDSGYANLIAAARDRLKRPWSNAPLDDSTIKNALGKKAERAVEALFLSDQVGPLLASHTMGNPRQIKRFLNTLLLRRRSADARGFGEDIKVPVLAKLMLAERFYPTLFDQIAAIAVSHPQGRCNDLAELEKMTSEQRTQTPKSDDEEEPKSDTTPVATSQSEHGAFAAWKSAPEFLAWSKVRPPIGELDLRPYLFVAKDKKDYFGAMSVLGHLAVIADKLLGNKLAILRLEPDLKQLTHEEAEKIFQALRSKIMAGDTYDTQPHGIDGMILLAKAQPDLCGKLFDFISSLPSDRCGPWIVGGWDVVFKNTEFEGRFSELLAKWSNLQSNSSLKMAASGVLNTSKQLKRNR